MQKPLPVKGHRSLDHIFSEEETKSMTENLTSQMMDVVTLSAEKKDNASMYKRKIDSLMEQNNNLAIWLHAGKKEQDTAVEVFHNWPKDGIKTIIRMDTNESWEEEMGYGDNTLDNNLPPGVHDGSNDEEE